MRQRSNHRRRRTHWLSVPFLLPLVAGMARADVIPIGEVLPSLRGELLSGRKLVLPDAASGAVTVLFMGFTYESRHDVEAWTDRLRREPDSASVVEYYEIPVMGGAARLARPFIDRGMRRGTPRDLHDRVLTVYRDAGGWKRRVEFSERDVAYLLLLDREGRLIWRGTGPFDEAAYQDLVQRVRRLME